MFLHIHVVCVFVFAFSFLMAELKIGSLNINGARSDVKRASLFKLMELKALDVIFLQETHSDVENESDWRKQWPGEVILSHKASNSGGVGVLFSKGFRPCSFSVEEIMCGHIIKIKVQYENVNLIFINVYAPVLAVERMTFLNLLCDVIQDCTDDFLFLGGDFNCTENPTLDRNHLEPHPASSARLRRLMEGCELKDVWRGFHLNARQYTWSHSRDNMLSLARLDRFYCFKHHFGVFKQCVITPVGFSDHCLVQCFVYIQNVKLHSAYWHFNTGLLNDNSFKEGFACVWGIHQSQKSSFPSLQQWWDIGKVQVKLFCQQYTRNVTKHITRSLQDLEIEVVELQELVDSTGNQGHVEALKVKKAALANLLGITAQGALVRCRFMNASQMDAPSQFFFGLERKNGQRKIIHSLRSADGGTITGTPEIRRYATSFYKDLFREEYVEDTESAAPFYDGLPQVGADNNTVLDDHLSLNELHVALMSLGNGKAPGIDGLPVDFYKTFWPVVGEDLLEVFQDSLSRGRLPLSCRRAVITLLPKKGDLQEIKNWRPVSLLCGDYKILSKALASRLREVMSEVVHIDQTYCVPGRLMSDNITLVRHVLDVSSSLAMDTGLISIDQEKAFDRVEHQYLWHTLNAFGFSPGFIAKIRVLYRDIASILKVNGGLAAPFNVQRGVRQGCSLSGMLYSLAIEPLLHKLRNELLGVYFPGCASAVKLSAYADDVVIVLNKQADINTLVANVSVFNHISSAKVNWAKSEAVVVGAGLQGTLSLPGGLTWKKGGIKYLGVFLGEDCVLEKNWDNALEKIEGRLKKWKWLLPSMSYRGRTLVINNLLASSLWHKLSCVDPPSNLLAKIQAVLVHFFWDKLHWIPQSVLFLPLEEGGQGLVHLASRGAAFRLQFLQRLLYGPKDLVWRPLAHWVLNSFKGFRLTDSLFLMDARKLSVQFLPPFYRGLFTVWKLVVKERRLQGDSLHWLLQEPVVYGDRLDYPCWAGSAITDTFCRARVLTLGTVVDITGHKLDNAAALAAVLGVRSVRIITKLLDYWKHKLSGHESIMLEQYAGGLTTPQTEDSFPDLCVRPCLDHYVGRFLNVKHCILDMKEVKGKGFYKLMVLCLNKSKLHQRVDTPWRGHLGWAADVQPAWRSLYKPPLTKRVADLQWRVLHGIVAVNKFLSVISPGASDKCPYCDETETVFHCYCECVRLPPLFLLLDKLFSKVGEVFSKNMFILGFRYSRFAKYKCQLLNFILGQSKMAVYVSRKRKVDDSVDVNVNLLFARMVKARIRIDFNYYAEMKDVDEFRVIWAHGDVLCSVEGDQLLFSQELMSCS